MGNPMVTTTAQDGIGDSVQQSFCSEHIIRENGHSKLTKYGKINLSIDAQHQNFSDACSFRSGSWKGDPCDRSSLGWQRKTDVNGMGFKVSQIGGHLSLIVVFASVL